MQSFPRMARVGINRRGLFSQRHGRVGCCRAGEPSCLRARRLGRLSTPLSPFDTNLDAMEASDRLRTLALRGTVSSCLTTVLQIFFGLWPE